VSLGSWSKDRFRVLVDGPAGNHPYTPAAPYDAVACSTVRLCIKYINITKVNGPEREKININYLLLPPWQLENKFNVVPEKNQALGSSSLNGLKYHLKPSL
jgi:hypothetical protein